MQRQPTRPATLEHLIGMGATDLTARAESGQLAHAHGREAAIEQVFQSLVARRSVLLLGPADVGKSAILHEVVFRMHRREAPEALHGKRVVAISTGRILTGTRYIGEWQTRLTNLLEAFKEDRNLLLYLEDIWSLRDAGRASDDADGFNVHIRPYLERQEVVVLGESTPENYVSSARRPMGLADDQSLMRCFDVITIEEPGPDATRGILQAASRQIQRAHRVRIEATAIERGLELTRRYLPYQAFPGKAIRLLETAATAPAAGRQDRRDGQPAAERIINAEAVTASFSRMTGLPEKIVSDAVPLSQREIRAYFEERIIGQEEAISAVVDVVTLVKAELHDPGRPLGVLFFVGPTGVGKTELAKTLAEYLFGSKEKLLRFDMSEYKTFTGLKDLLEQLTEKQRRQSFSVLLLDEFEKAIPPVYDLFLQVFDDARLTDPAGRVVDLHNTIVIMTSNLSSDLTEDRPIRSIGFIDPTNNGAASPEEARARLIAAVEAYFRPEFINRLDRIVTFRPLGVEEMRRIARRELGKALVREGVLRRNILLDFRPEVVEALVEVGFSPAYGARPLQRAIRDAVLLPLARKIAEQPATGEQLLELCVRDGRIEPEIIPFGPLPEAELPEPEPERASARRVRPAVGDGRARGRDLRQLTEAIEQLRERLEAHIGSERYGELETRAERLLEETAQPSFWDNQERSQQVFSTIYHLKRVTERFTDLRNRTERLSEMATMIARHGDGAGLRELVERHESLARDVALAELELLASDGTAPATDAAFICIGGVTTPRGGDAGDWPTMLQAMYEAWAQRKGYEITTIGEDGADPLLLVQGPGVYQILCGEQGIHKLQMRGAAESTREQTRGRGHDQVRLARVEVFPAPRPGQVHHASGDGSVQVSVIGEIHSRDGQERPRRLVEVSERTSGLRVRVQAQDGERLGRALLEARRPHGIRGATLDGGEQVVRVYCLARSQYVRDPRTEARNGRPREVLAGAIDAFLLAYLKWQEGGAGADGSAGQAESGDEKREPLDDEDLVEELSGDE
jgi:ATP-dependent Clp protease ATP-binding subunit ClpA